MTRALLPLLAAGCIPRLYSSGTTDSGGPWVAPENTWEQAEPPADLVGEGYEPGQVVPDFRLEDQFGDEVALWQFFGDVILLDVSTIWCAPCQLLAEDAEETWQEYREQGFVYVTVLQEDYEGNPPEADDLQLWVDLYELTAPVLSDPDLSGAGGALVNDQWPAVLVIGRDLRVIERVLPDDAEVRAAIEAAL